MSLGKPGLSLGETNLASSRGVVELKDKSREKICCKAEDRVMNPQSLQSQEDFEKDNASGIVF